MPLNIMLVKEEMKLEKSGKCKSDDEFYELTSIGGKTGREDKVEKPELRILSSQETGVPDLEVKHRKKCNVNPGFKILEKVDDVRGEEIREGGFEVEKGNEYGMAPQDFMFSLKELVFYLKRKKKKTGMEREMESELGEEREKLEMEKVQEREQERLEQEKLWKLNEEKRERETKLEGERERARILEAEIDREQKLEEEGERPCLLGEEKYYEYH